MYHSETTEQIRILILEDNPADAELVLWKVRDAGFRVEADIAADSLQFVEKIQTGVYDLVLADYRLPDWNGLDALQWMQTAGYHIPFILVTGTLGDELAVECIKSGATDYILKDRLDRLPLAVRRVMQEEKLRRDEILSREQLHESERQVQSLIDRAPYGIFRALPSGELLMVNPALVTMLGYSSQEELLRLRLFPDISWNRSDLANGEVRYGEGPEIVGYETKWRRKDNKIITVRLVTQNIKGPERSIYEVFVENITAQRLLEQQFRQAQKMEAIGRLAGGIAHDFNNMLSVIIGLSDIDQEYVDLGSPIYVHLQEIKKAGQRAAVLTRQLLAFSRQQVMQPTLLNLNMVTENISRMLQHMIGEDITLATITDEDLGVVTADSAQIEQVLMNLAVNARDAMARGGKLTIRTKNVDLREGRMDAYVAIPPGSYVALSVSDNGIGMNEETIGRIFEPFFTTKEPGKGTGLGLSTVYGVIEQTGGYIAVDSSPGQGSTFTMYFPRSSIGTGAAYSAMPQFEKHAKGGTETILVVEDDDAVRKFTVDLLTNAGYNRSCRN
jgi:PAS domain S-box-containing protein